MEKKSYKEMSSVILEGVRKVAKETYPNLPLEVFITPFGEGARLILMKAGDRKAYPVSTACVSSFEAPTKDIVHGLWGVLKKRGEHELSEKVVKARKILV